MNISNDYPAKYRVLITEEAQRYAKAYFSSVLTGKRLPGERFATMLKAFNHHHKGTSTCTELLECLLNTKYIGDDSLNAARPNSEQWNADELMILKSVMLFTHVSVFDNAAVKHIVAQRCFSEARLILLSDGDGLPVIQTHHEADENGAYDPRSALVPTRIHPQLCWKNRLLAALLWISDDAMSRMRPAVVTMPVMPDKQAHTKVVWSDAERLMCMIKELLLAHADKLEGITTIHVTTNIRCPTRRYKVAGVRLKLSSLGFFGKRLGPLSSAVHRIRHKAKLPNPLLYSLVNVDSRTWPCRSTGVETRASDASCKVAATDLMHQLTGCPGEYDESRHVFVPRGEYNSWGELIMARDIRLRVQGNCIRMNHSFEWEWHHE